MDNAILSTHVGMVGVYRAAAELLLRGYKPYVPVVDSHGVDLMVVPNIRLQVKSATLAPAGRGTNQPGYPFDLRRTRTKANRPLIRDRRIYSSSCDFVVLHGINENLFWIVPAKVLDDKTNVFIGPTEGWKDVNLDTVRRFRASGMTWKEVAAKFNVNPATIYNRLVGKGLAPKRSAVAHIVRKGEGRWDLLGAPQ